MRFTEGLNERTGRGRDARRRRWERATDGLLTVVALVFLLVYAVPILRPGLDPGVRHAFSVIEWIVWAVFAVDLAVRFVLAERKLAFLREAWLDLLLLLLPMFRPLRAVMALSVIGRHGGVFVRGRVVASVGAAVVLVAFVASLAVLEAERDAPGSPIHTFGDAIWWAAATVTTVGYGDLTPVTPAGRTVALALMITGIGLLGVVTAALASWFVEKVGKVEDDARRTADEVDDLTAAVRALRKEVAALAGEHGHAPTSARRQWDETAD